MVLQALTALRVLSVRLARLVLPVRPAHLVLRAQPAGIKMVTALPTLLKTLMVTANSTL